MRKSLIDLDMRFGKSPVYTQSIKFDRIELVVSETNVRTHRHRLHIMPIFRMNNKVYFV